MKKLITLFFLLLSFSASAQLAPSGKFHKQKPAPYTAQVEYEAVGTQSSGTTSCAPAYPTVAAGNGLIMAVGTKLRDAKVEAPEGWEWLDETMDMVESSGSDVGEIRQTLFWKEATGFESGTISVTCGTCNSMNAVIYAFSKSSNARWEVNTSGGSDMTAGTGYSVTSKEKFQSRRNDLLLAVSSINTDAYAYVDQAVTQTGATFSTISAEIGEYATVSGNDQEQIASVFQVTAASVVPAKFVYVATANGSAASNPLGTTHFVQLRQYFAYQDLPPSGFYSWDASEAIDNTWSGDGQTLWDGMRTSLTSTGTVSGAGYDIETFDGELCFKYAAILQDATNYWQRAEVSKPTPWQPRWPIGTIIIHEIMFKTPANAPDVYLEFDYVQNHAGTEPGGPWPLNSPIYYFAFAHAGQTGWTNTGDAATGGEMAIVLKTASPDVRHLITGFDCDWEASATYQVRHMVKHDIASGDPALVVWVKKNGGAWNLVYSNYTDKTVWETDDIAVDGSPILVGGAIKTGVYNHLITNGTTAANSIAAGNSGYTIYVPRERMIIQLPTYFDYITDVTDNANPIYNKVSTD